MNSDIPMGRLCRPALAALAAGYDYDERTRRVTLNDVEAPWNPAHNDDDSERLRKDLKIQTSWVQCDRPFYVQLRMSVLALSREWTASITVTPEDSESDWLLKKAWCLREATLGLAAKLALEGLRGGQ